MIEFRSMQAGDIGAGLQLCREANWNQVRRDWEIFLTLGPDACRVAGSGDKVVGTVATITYGQSFSWIGLVLVDKAFQRQGIGIRLLQEALAILAGEETVKLDATPAGRDVYLKLNFADEYELSRMQLAVNGNDLPASTARLILKKDLPKLIKFDRKIFGADRGHLLEWMFGGWSHRAFMGEAQEGINGFCMARQGHNYIHVGPVVANDISTAKNLVSAALKTCAGQPVIIDAMNFDLEWVTWLKSIGFTLQRNITRMYRGPNNFPGIPQKQFAILGPEFG